MPYFNRSLIFLSIFFQKYGKFPEIPRPNFPGNFRKFPETVYFDFPKFPGNLQKFPPFTGNCFEISQNCRKIPNQAGILGCDRQSLYACTVHNCRLHTVQCFASECQMLMAYYSYHQECIMLSSMSSTILSMKLPAR